MKQRQVEQCLDRRHRPALRDKARAAYWKDAVRHQHRHGVARVCPATEANREVNAGSAEIEQARVGDQLQLNVRVQCVKMRQSRDQPPRRDGRQQCDGQPLRVAPQVEVGDCACNIGDGLVDSLRQATAWSTRCAKA